MPNIDDLYTSKFLKAYDLQGREPVVTIARVEFEPMGRTREIKAVVYFQGKAKALKLNKTMAVKLAQIAGSAQTEEWTGLKVQLYVTTADFGGEAFDVVRVKAPTATTARQTPSAGVLKSILPAPRKPVMAATGTDMLAGDAIFARGSRGRSGHPAAEDDDVPF